MQAIARHQATSGRALLLSEKSQRDCEGSFISVFVVKWADTACLKSFDFRKSSGLDLTCSVLGLVFASQPFLCQVTLFSAAALLWLPGWSWKIWSPQGGFVWTLDPRLHTTTRQLQALPSSSCKSWHDSSMPWLIVEYRPQGLWESQSRSFICFHVTRWDTVGYPFLLWPCGITQKAELLLGL